MLRVWVRRGSPAPVEHLLAGDFAAFEDDLAQLAERGFTVRRRRPQPITEGRAASRPARRR